MRKFFVLVCAHGGLEVRGRRPRAHSPTPTVPPPTNGYMRSALIIAMRSALMKLQIAFIYEDPSYNNQERTVKDW